MEKFLTGYDIMGVWIGYRYFLFITNVLDVLEAIQCKCGKQQSCEKKITVTTNERDMETNYEFSRIFSWDTKISEIEDVYACVVSFKMEDGDKSEISTYEDFRTTEQHVKLQDIKKISTFQFWRLWYFRNLRSAFLQTGRLYPEQALSFV